MKKRTKLFLVIVAICFTVAGYMAWQLFGPTVKVPEGKYFYINTGAIYQNVKDSLIKKDIIKRQGLFDRMAKYLHYDRSVKAGKYMIPEGMSLVSLIRMLRAGNQSPVNLVITKLRTKEDLAQKIGVNFEQDSNMIIQFLNNTDSLFKYNLDTNTVLTAVIPNTYTFTWNSTPSRIFKKLFSEQEKFWNAKRKTSASALGLSVKEVYILASIVEEETNKLEDKGKMASVYINRMRAGMRLAADPTVKFALRNFGLKRIYFKHLAYSSPYNTYLNSGLPPGPICTPSIKTIDAVLAAPKTNYLFFVAKPDFSGYSNFASGYTQHLIYAKAYQNALDSVIELKKQKQEY
ncbi:MAG: endolytic transglycosylase MltG [Chitinophagaceae bacterium]|nr:endolytic transglycosylase MltG [Chitinophagaceae bacterium]